MNGAPRILGFSLTPLSNGRFNTRGYVPREPFKCFQRTLTAHLTASDGRAPFDPEEEVAIMSVLTQKKQWPAFEGTTSTIGATGFRSTGFHELGASYYCVRPALT